MIRTELYAALKRVEPALSVKDMIPVLACLCFDGKYVTAYDELVALQVPIDVPIKGAVRGKLLLDFINASKAREAEITQTKLNLEIALGRSTFKTTLLPEEDFIFEFPSTKGAMQLELTAKFQTTLDKAMTAIGLNPSTTWRCGVTVVFEKDEVVMYATDNITIVRAWSKMDVPKAAVGSSILLPPRFCDLMTSIGANDTPIEMLFTADWVRVEFKSGLYLFSRLSKETEVGSYEDVFSSTIDSKKAPKGVEIPEGIGGCLDRASVVLPYADDPHTAFRVEAENDEPLRLRLTTKSGMGDVRDQIKIDTHPDAVERLSPAAVRRGLKYSKRFCIIPGSCMALMGDGYHFMISSVAQDEQPK